MLLPTARHLRPIANHGLPLADSPVRNKTIDHIRVILGKLFSRFGRPEHQRRAIQRICERTRNHDLAAVKGLLRRLQMSRAMRSAFLRYVRDIVIEEDVVHASTISATALAAASQSSAETSQCVTMRICVA